ncbi:MAG: helix-turn-helix domain-containing protein [Propionicimonas sp.]|uniref:TetR/AcrR family transcriptional regulator n=1 Tax=Propionicimonas sp. TaxID=1955623 RepID=UPI003D13BAF1
MPAARPQRADALRNRRRILDAASEQITANGPDVGMDEIATAAGVAVGTLYRHFPTKADLLSAVIAVDIAQIADDAEASLARTEGGARPVDEVVGFLHRVADATAHSHAVKAAAAGLGVPGHGDQTDEARAAAAVGALLAAAQRDGDVRPHIGVEDIYLLMTTAPSEHPEQIPRWLDLIVPGITTDGARDRK